MKKHHFYSVFILLFGLSTATYSVSATPATVFMQEKDTTVAVPTALQDTPTAQVFIMHVSGKVLDATGVPIQGASIFVKGSNIVSTSGPSGNYNLYNIPQKAEGGTIVVFSAVGYSSQERAVSVHDSTLNITLQQAATTLDEVVVATALGIQRKEKTLTYAVQTVGNSELTGIKDPSFINSLTGKVAGVTITKSSSGIGGSVKVVLRGNKSTRNNQPLYVIDGVPMLNSSPAQPTDELGQSGVGYAGIDGGDGISNLNPDDIASMSILKGASAAALYGSAAANGVILITTKKGQAGTTKINISSEWTADRPMYQQPLQFKYGQTTPATTGSPGSVDSWGEVVNAPNHAKNFFQTGLTAINSISLAGGNDKSQTYLSYANTTNNGMMPTSKFSKHNINFHQTNKFFDDKLTTDFNALYIQQSSHNRPSSGVYNNPLTGLYEFPRGLDFNYYKNNYAVYSPIRNMNIQNWWNANYDKNITNPGAWVGSETNQNPYWLLRQNSIDNTLNRVYANVSVAYKFTNWLRLQARGNIDKSYNTIDGREYATTSVVISGLNGGYHLLNVENTQLYSDLILSANKKFGSDISINAALGTSINDTKTSTTNFGSKEGVVSLQVPNLFLLTNIAPAYLSISNPINGMPHKQVQAVFGTVQLGYKNAVFLDLTGRNDWSSSFALTPVENKGYFYYSVGVNAILTELIKFPEAISFAKIRASYAQVGNDVDAYATGNSVYYSNFNASQPTTKRTVVAYPGTYLQPEINKSYEIGTEWRFLRDRVGFDITFYQNNNTNQYLTVPAPAASGYTSYYINAGNIQNRGIELMLTVTPIDKKKIQWTSYINYALNQNKIISLTSQQDYFALKTIGNNLTAYNMVAGGQWGDIYGRFFQKDDKGRIMLDKDGTPYAGTASGFVGDQSTKLIGNPNPMYTLGWNNHFVLFKRFNVSFLIDGRVGGKVISTTQAILDQLGVSKTTENARNNGGVAINAVDIDGNPVSKIDAKIFYNAAGGLNGITENYAYDATSFRLREVVIGYNIPLKTTKIRTLQVSIIGRNLFFLYKKAPFDPELSMSTNNTLQGNETFGMPTATSVGAALKIGF